MKRRKEREERGSSKKRGNTHREGREEGREGGRE